MLKIPRGFVPVRGFPGYYVNRKGEFGSTLFPTSAGTKTVPFKRLRMAVTTHGYLIAQFQRKKETHRFHAHRVVARAFIPNPKRKPFVNHKNGTQLDNRAANLEWCTAKENSAHSKHVLKRLSIKKSAPLLGHTKKIRKMLSQGKPQTEIAKLFGVHSSSISNIATGKSWRHA